MKKEVAKADKFKGAVVPSSGHHNNTGWVESKPGAENAAPVATGRRGRYSMAIGGLVAKELMSRLSKQDGVNEEFWHKGRE